jgi:hypothetical protein
MAGIYNIGADQVYDNNGQTFNAKTGQPYAPQAPVTPNATPGSAQTPQPGTPSPLTIKDLYGGLTPDDTAINNAVGIYRDASQAPVDEQAIRDNVTKQLQAEIDATNSVYAEKLRQAQIVGQGQLGQNAAISARCGLLGSDFGAAANDTVNKNNEAVYSGIGDEQAAAIAGITDKGNALAQQEIAAKNAVKQQSASDYISFLSTQDQRRTTRTTDAAQRALAAGIDLTTASPDDINAIASSYQIAPDALVSSYVSAKNTAAKAKADLASTVAGTTKPVFGTVGTVGYQFNPTTGAYEKIPGSGGSDLISAAINDGRLDPSQVSRYNIASITDALNADPTHDFVAGKQNLLNSTSYTKDAFGNIVPVKKFPGVSSGGGASGGSTAGGGSGGGTQFPKADAASLQQQQLYADSTQRAFNTANANFQALIPFMKTAGVNSGSTVPLVNSLQNRVKAGTADPGTIAAFKAAIAGLRAEYAQVLSRGGEVTDGQRNAASTLIPDDLTPAQLQQVADRLNIEGTNAVKEANAQIQTIKDRVNGVSATSAGSSTDIESLRAKYQY